MTVFRIYGRLKSCIQPTFFVAFDLKEKITEEKINQNQKQGTANWCCSFDDYDDYFSGYIGNHTIKNIKREHWRKSPDFNPPLKLIHLASDVFPYWCQLLQIIAIAAERYILICKGEKAETILNKRNRKIFYFLTITISMIAPVCLLLQHFYKEHNKVTT